MINLELYKIFVIVANENNITRASEILHISQPAITKHIKNLESQLYTKLFERTKYGLNLTEEGNRLYNQIKDSINLLIKAEEQFNANRIINVGTRTMILSKIFSKGITNFYNKYPNGRIDIQINLIPEMLESLQNHKLDIVLTKKIECDKYDKIKFISLGYLHDIFATKKDSKYTTKMFSKNDLKNENIYINTSLGKSVSTINLKNILEIDNNDNVNNLKQVGTGTIIQMLKKDEIIAFITKEFIQEELDENQIEIIKTNFEIPTTEFGIYYNVDNKFKQLDELIQCIKSECSFNFT